MNYRSSEDGNIMVTVLVTQDGERHTETRSFPGFLRTLIKGFESRLSLFFIPRKAGNIKALRGLALQGRPLRVRDEGRVNTSR